MRNYLKTRPKRQYRTLLTTARFSSALSVDDFAKKSQYTYKTEEALSLVAEKVAFFAEKEGLTAHAKSATIRIEDKK